MVLNLISTTKKLERKIRKLRETEIDFDVLEVVCVGVCRIKDKCESAGSRIKKYLRLSIPVLIITLLLFPCERC